MIDLFYYPSPNVRKVLIALEELGLPYTVRWTDIREGDQFDPAYVKVNPNSKVPAIVDHDGPGGGPIALFESAAILLYLSEKAGGALMPVDPALRWEATCWVMWQVANQGPMAGQAAHFVSHAPQHGIDVPYAVQRYSTEVRRLYQVLDDRLAGREYLVGEEFTMADVISYPWVRVARGHGVDVSQYPHVVAWTQRIGQRASVKVRIEDPREAGALKQTYSAEQFETLFRADVPKRGEAS